MCVYRLELDRQCVFSIRFRICSHCELWTVRDTYLCVYLCLFCSVFLGSSTVCCFYFFGRFVRRSSFSIVLILPGLECSCASHNRSRSVCLIYDFLTSQVSIEKLRSSVVYGARICEVFLLPFVPLFFLMIFVFCCFFFLNFHSRICLWISSCSDVSYTNTNHLHRFKQFTVVFDYLIIFVWWFLWKYFFRPFVTHLMGFYLFYQLNITFVDLITAFDSTIWACLFWQRKYFNWLGFDFDVWCEKFRFQFEWRKKL